MKTIWAMGVALVFGLAPALAYAQDAATGGAPAAPTADSQAQPADAGIADIVVTAERRTSSLQRTGTALSVVTGDALIQQGVTTAQDLGRLVPALNVQGGGGANAIFFLRGVGNFTVNGYSDPAIAFNYDGVYVGRPTSTSGTFYDLERIEVLKGPQGTLYGRNATGGAINVIPTRPKLGETSGYATFSYGNYDAKVAQGAVNIAMGEHGALRISGNYVNRDGYLSDGTRDDKGYGVRIQMMSELTPALTVRVAVDYSHTGGLGEGTSYAGSNSYNFATRQFTFNPSGFDTSVGLLDPRSQAYRVQRFAGLPGRTLARLDDNVYQRNDFFGANAEIDYQTGAGTLTIIPAWRYATIDNRFDSPGYIGYIQEKDEQHSIEARFSGNRIGIFDYIVGGLYFDESIRGNYTFDQTGFAAYQDFTSSTKSTAGFVRLTANLSDRLRLIGGARYTDDRKRFDGAADVVLVSCTVRVNGVPSCPNAPLIPVTDTLAQLPFAVPTIGGRPIPIGTTGAIAIRANTPVHTPLNNDRLTYRLAAEFDLAPRSLLYASYETGYRSGGFNLSAGYETFRPEYLDAYTIGIKNRLFGNRLQLNIEGFYWKYRDQQAGHTGVDKLGVQGNFVENIGRSTLKGVEAEAQLLATKTTLLSANVQYLDSKYKDFTYQVPVGAAPPYVGCPAAIDPPIPPSMRSTARDVARTTHPNGRSISAPSRPCRWASTKSCSRPIRSIVPTAMFPSNSCPTSSSRQAGPPTPRSLSRAPTIAGRSRDSCATSRMTG